MPKVWNQTKDELQEEKDLLAKGCTLRDLAELREKQGLTGELARVDSILPERSKPRATINVFKL